MKFTPWKVGDKVWLEGRNLRLHYPTKKLAPQQEGPFKISHVISPLAYRLQLPPTWKIHDVFHASLLSTYQVMQPASEPAGELAWMRGKSDKCGKGCD